LRFKPEELVRQHTLRTLINELGYSKDQIAVEVGVVMGSQVHDKPADIIVYADQTKATERLIVELKKPRRTDGIEQLQSYMNATGTPFGWWTNGSDNQYLLRTDPNIFSWRLTRVPAEGEALEDVDDPITKGDLRPASDLLDLLRACEDEILAHQSVDTFDELFKIVYAKLYDERMNLAQDSDVCEFRIGITEEPAAAARRVRRLYDRARNKWKGVFKDDIELTDQNLAFVIAALQEYEFIGEKSGDVLGVAFEAMINPQTKGDKGQYGPVPSQLQERLTFIADLTRVRLKDAERVPPHYLLAFLRNPLGRLQVRRCIRGVRAHVYPEDVADVVQVPMPDQQAAE
jgi:type I restriction enzyme M protein